MKKYIIKTERLGLRNWTESDKEPFIEMCKDESVMKHFPNPLSKEETLGLIERLQAHFTEYGYTYFAVDILETKEFIGFTGFANQTWKSKYTPCVDIGWRFKKKVWGKGYATEAAKGCFNAGYPKFGLTEVLAFATDTNEPSENIMKKLRMELIGTVQHPSIINDSRFKHCVVYRSRL